MKALTQKDSLKTPRPGIFYLIAVLALVVLLVILAHVPTHQVVASQPSFTGILGELTDGEQWAQDFVCSGDGLCGIDVFMATYARPNQGTLQFRLRQTAPPEAGQVTERAATKPLATLRDNSFVEFRFAPIERSRGAAFRFILTSPDAAVGNAVTAYWSEKVSSADGFLCVDNRAPQGNLCFRAVAAAKISAAAAHAIAGITARKPSLFGHPSFIATAAVTLAVLAIVIIRSFMKVVLEND